MSEEWVDVTGECDGDEFGIHHLGKDMLHFELQNYRVRKVQEFNPQNVGHWYFIVEKRK